MSYEITVSSSEGEDLITVRGETLAVVFGQVAIQMVGAAEDQDVLEDIFEGFHDIMKQVNEAKYAEGECPEVFTYSKQDPDWWSSWTITLKGSVRE